MCFQEDLRAQQKQVINREYRPDDNLACMNCGEKHPHWRASELIRRHLRYFIDERVQKVAVFVLKWACGFCKKAFRHLPPFLQPYKRFATPSIIEVVEKSLDSPSPKHTTYEDTVTRKSDDRKLIYDDASGSRVSPSTCWVWISWMSEIMVRFTLRNPMMATEMTLSETESDFHRFHPRQARSKERFASLHNARKLLLSKRLNPQT